jgi:hypothetical protein
MNALVSKIVAIVVQKFPENGNYAPVLNQRCKSCQDLGALQLNKAYYVD